MTQTRLPLMIAGMIALGMAAPASAQNTTSITKSHDPATQTWTSERSATNGAGQTATSTATKTKTDNGYTRSRSVQNSDGETRARRDATVTRSDNGVTRNVTRQGRRS